MLFTALWVKGTGTTGTATVYVLGVVHVPTFWGWAQLSLRRPQGAAVQQLPASGGSNNPAASRRMLYIKQHLVAQLLVIELYRY